MQCDSLHCDERGTGPAVVLLHGTPSSVDDFAPLVDALAIDHRVVVPHLPGYGRTPPDAEPDSFDGISRRIEKRLLGMGITRADFVAFSGGAHKAVAIALAGHLVVSRLALLAPVVGLDDEARRIYRQVAAASRSGAFDPRPTWLERMASPGFGVRNPAGAARIFGWLEAVSLTTICDELVALADSIDLRPRLGALDADVLVCSGTADAAVPPAWAEDVARRARRGKFQRIEGAGHALLVEEPARVTELVGTFLANSTDGA